MIGEVLALEVTLKGIEKVHDGLSKVTADFEGAEAKLKTVAKGFALMTTAIVMASKAAAEASQEEAALATLSGLAGGLEKAHNLMEKINAVARRGVFGKREAEDAVTTMTKWGVAQQKNIDLAERLGAITGKAGGMAQAAELIGRIQGGGQTSRLAMQLREYGIGPKQLKEAGLDVHGMEIKNTPEEIMAALERIAKSSGALDARMGTLAASTNAARHELDELWQSVGNSLLPILKPLTRALAGLFAFLGKVNDALMGIPGALALLATFGYGLKMAWGALQFFTGGARTATAALTQLAFAARGAAISQGAGAGAGVAGAAAGAAKVGILARIAAMWAPVAAWFVSVGAWLAGVGAAIAASGVLVTIATAVAAIAAIGSLFYGVIQLVRWLGGKQFKWNPFDNSPSAKPVGAGTSEGARKVPAAHERPIRRDDYERIQERIWKRAMA